MTEITLPAPDRTQRHEFVGGWAKGGNWSLVIAEDEYQAFTSLTVHTDDAGWIGTQKLGGLIALRISEGYQLISADSRSAYLRKSARFDCL